MERFSHIFFLIILFHGAISLSAQNNNYYPYSCGRIFKDLNEIRDDVKVSSYLENVDFPGGSTIADIGAENGYLSVVLSLFTDSLAFFLEDISPVCLNNREFLKVRTYYETLADKKLKSSFHLKIGVQNNTGFPDNFFDIIMMNDVIHQLFFPDSFFSHIRKIMKNSGSLYIGQYENNGIDIQEIVFLLKKNGFQLKRKIKKENYNLLEFVKSEPETHITNIHEATLSGDFELFKKYFKNTDELNSAGMTALHYAAKYGRLDILKFLIEKGANVNITGHKYAISPLMLAVRCNQTEAALTLIKAGADVNHIFEGKSVLMIAARNGNTELVNALINHKANTHYQFEGVSYQFFAAESGSLELMKYLYKIGEINRKMMDADKKTLLFYAVKSGNLEIVKYLVEIIKIDPNQKDNSGKSAAMDADDFSIFEYLNTFKKS